MDLKRLYNDIQRLKRRVDNLGGGTDLTGDVTLNTNSSNVTTVAGQLTASVGLNLGGDLTLNEYIRRSSDSDTNIRFTEDNINITAGAANMLDFTQEDSGQDEITFNEGGTDIDFRIESSDESHMLFIEASSNRMSIGDNTGSPGATLEIKNHNSAGATGVPLLQLNNNDTDKQCLDINASNITANVVNVTANDVTTARVLAIGADGLTTGNAFYVDDNSADTGTRKTALIIQNNAAAINAQALTVQSDGGKIGVNIDKNYSDTTEASIVGLNIDWDKTGASTSDNTMYGIQLDMDNSTAENGTNYMYGLHVTPTLTHAVNAGNTFVYGALINAQGGTNGTSYVQGMRVEAGGGDINYGIQLDVEDGGVDLRIESSADNGDYFQIQTTTHGATTITTVDDNATAANLTFDIDGNFVVTGSGKVGINTDTPMNRLQINHAGDDGDNGLLIVRKDADNHVYTGDLLGGIGIDASDGNVPSSILEASAYIAAYAAENFDNNNKGGNLAFGCTLIDDNDDTTSHEYMRITNAGRVGIGTTEPIGRFQVMITSANHEDGVLIIHEASTGISDGDWIGGIGFDTADGNVPSRVNEASAFIGAYAAEAHATTDKAGHLVFGCTAIDDDDDTASHEYMRITSEGRIGIGTTAPANRLQISHTAADNDDGLMIVRADTSTADTDLLGGIGFDSTDGNVPSTITEASCFIAAFAAEAHGTGDKGGDLTFGCSKIDDNDDTASHEYMRITSEGNVGIGTNDPDYTLDVAGNIGLDEYIYHNGDADTFIRFTGDDINFRAGGVNMMDFTEGAAGAGGASHEITFNENNADLDFRVESQNHPHMLFVDASTDRVGINMSSPAELLHIEENDGSNAAVIQLTRLDAAGAGGIADGNIIGSIRFGGTTDNGSNYSYNSAVISAIADGDWNTASDDEGASIIFKTTPDGSNSNAEVMRIGGNGRVGIGCTPAQPFHVLTDNASGYAAKFKNDGDNANRYGIILDCGADNAAGTNTAFIIRDGNGGTQGEITFTGGTVTYGAFTGHHPAALPEDDEAYDYGTIVKIISTNTLSETYNKSVQYDVDKTTTAKDKAALGVYSVAIGERYDEDGSPGQEHNRHQIWALGDGHILVCSEGGNIEIGDYICSSNTAGHGMKQDDDLLHNYTVAKATQAVDWSTESGNTKLISCTYHAS